VVVAGPAPTSAHPHVTIVGGRKTVTLPSTSPEWSMANLARQWKQVDRPGQLYRPILARSGRQLATVTLEVTADAEAMDSDVEALIAALVALSDGTEPLVLAYGSLTSHAAIVGQGTWRLTTLDPSITREEPGTNRAMAATIRLTFTEASDIEVTTTPATATLTPVKGAPKRYVVKAGESLSDIAARFYGRATAWQALADANGIRDPKPSAIAGKSITLVGA